MSAHDYDYVSGRTHSLPNALRTVTAESLGPEAHQSDVDAFCRHLSRLWPAGSDGESGWLTSDELDALSEHVFRIYQKLDWQVRS